MYSTPPRPFLWGFLIALTLHIGATFSQAQPPPGEPQVSVLIIAENVTKEVKMSTGKKIAQVRNENPKVCRVQTKADDPFAVLVTGLSQGSSRLTLVDENKSVDALDILVQDASGIQFELQRKKFLELVRKVVPTASIDITNPGSNSVALSGYVPEVQMIQAVLDLAGRAFEGANVLNYIRVGGVQQVQLEVTVAVVNRSEARNMAFNFFQNGPNWFLNSFINPPFAATSSIATGAAGSGIAASGSPNVTFGILNSNSSFGGFLTALRNENLVKILAEPRVVTLSGKPAYIISGGETPIVTSSSGGTGVQYKQFGTVVNFVPIVLGNGKIHLEVRPELSTIDATAGINISSTGSLASAPGFKVRSAQVAVQMEDGQTLAIGGLIQNTINNSTNKVPILGDLPFLGAAFRTVSSIENEEELIIIVTPRLIDPLNCHQVPKVLPGRETRNADDFELFLEGIMEAPRGQRVVCPNNHYLASHRGGHTAGTFPCGDQGRGWNRNACKCGNPSCNGVHTSPFTNQGNYTVHRPPTVDLEQTTPDTATLGPLTVPMTTPTPATPTNRPSPLPTPDSILPPPLPGSVVPIRVE